MSTFPSVTIVCVYNDPEVRAECLDRSIDAHRHEMPHVEYLPIDNTAGRFTSAGAALNHGASRARNDYVVFVHQDVHLHSLTALGRVAQAMRHGDIGLVGAVGITADGRVVGRMRDRVVLIGDPATSPVDVDSVDEVLFVIPTAQVLAEPLSESPEFAWHAYGVEYGLRMRAAGKRVTAMDVPLTHNSMSTNLARLSEAHEELARRYPAAVPLRTTCGYVRAKGSGPRSPRALRRVAWRYRWLRNSLRVREVRRALGDVPIVLDDIRDDIDGLLTDLGGPLRIVNVETVGDGAGPQAEHLQLRRGDRPVEFRVTDRAGVVAHLDAQGDQENALLTNLAPEDLPALRGPLSRHRRLVGFHEHLGCWVLVGPAAESNGWLWGRQGATPLSERVTAGGS